MENLKEQLKLLVELQGVDAQIIKLEDELLSIPVRIKELEDTFKAKDANLKSLENSVKTLQLKRKEKEGDLETKEGGIKKFQQQQNLVKTNKEYSALQDEIARAKADCSIIEEQILNLFDQIDAENKKASAEKEFLKGEEVKVSNDKKKIAEEGDSIKVRLDTLKPQRADIAAKVDKELLKKYERIIKNKDGVAVVKVVNEACQGCFRVLPPQVTNEINMWNDVVYCDNCSRILYIEE